MQTPGRYDFFKTLKDNVRDNIAFMEKIKPFVPKHDQWLQASVKGVVLNLDDFHPDYLNRAFNSENVERNADKMIQFMAEVIRATVQDHSMRGFSIQAIVTLGNYTRRADVNVSRGSRPGKNGRT